MIFNSLAFLIFLPIVLLVFHVSSFQYRKHILLIASLIFYGFWSVKYLAIMILAVVPDFVFALLIQKSSNNQKRNNLLFLSVLSNFLLLVYFKYLGMLGLWIESFVQIWNQDFNINLWHIILPLGISFHRFQGQSYVIDVFQKKTKAIKSFSEMVLFIFYFPQLVAGPIERASHLLQQLRKPEAITMDHFRIGVGWILCGFFKKLVIADRLAPMVAKPYASMDTSNLIAFVLATYFFAFQIYTDFSGYSDIAKGCSKLFGINLMTNFNTPYRATSIAEFWQRWHISLSTWFKDYVYVPLGGNRVSRIKWARNILIVFSVSGLWHGASINFVIWGLIHAAYIILEKFFTDLKIKVKFSFSFSPFIKRTICFHLVCIAWIWFRTPDFKSILDITSRLPELFQRETYYLDKILHSLGEDASIIEPISLGIIALLFGLAFIHWLSDRIELENKSWTIYYSFVLLMILFFGVMSDSSFIYFQF